MKTKIEWKVNLANRVITEEMLAAALYSVNKRAKNCRDKRGKEKGSSTYHIYNETMTKYYDIKNDLLLAVLKPFKVHEVPRYTRTGYYIRTEHYLLYKTSYGSYHMPIRPEDASRYRFETSGSHRHTGNPFVPHTTVLKEFKTHGEDINKLASAQFACAVHALILSGDYTYLPADSDISKKIA